jgi:hypothetical protein
MRNWNCGALPPAAVSINMILSASYQVRADLCYDRKRYGIRCPSCHSTVMPCAVHSRSVGNKLELCAQDGYEEIDRRGAEAALR